MSDGKGDAVFSEAETFSLMRAGLKHDTRLHSKVMKLIVKALHERLTEIKNTPQTFQKPLKKVGDRYFPDAVKKEDQDYFVEEEERQGNEPVQLSGWLRRKAFGNNKIEDSDKYPFSRKFVKRKKHKHRAKLPPGFIVKPTPIDWQTTGDSRVLSKHPLPQMTLKASNNVSSNLRRQAGWVTANESAGDQEARRIQHLMHIVRKELENDTKREIALLQAKPDTIQHVTSRVVQERAEACDWIVRILDGYGVVSRIKILNYLKETFRTPHSQPCSRSPKSRSSSPTRSSVAAKRRGTEAGGRGRPLEKRAPHQHFRQPLQDKKDDDEKSGRQLLESALKTMGKTPKDEVLDGCSIENAKKVSLRRIMDRTKELHGVLDSLGFEHLNYALISGVADEMDRVDLRENPSSSHAIVPCGLDALDAEVGDSGKKKKRTPKKRQWSDSCHAMSPETAERLHWLRVGKLTLDTVEELTKATELLEKRSKRQRGKVKRTLKKRAGAMLDAEAGALLRRKGQPPPLDDEWGAIKEQAKTIVNGDVAVKMAGKGHLSIFEMNRKLLSSQPKKRERFKEAVSPAAPTEYLETFERPEFSKSYGFNRGLDSFQKRGADFKKLTESALKELRTRQDLATNNAGLGSRHAHQILPHERQLTGHPEDFGNYSHLLGRRWSGKKASR